jgi:hypothetical protein
MSTTTTRRVDIYTPAGSWAGTAAARWDALGVCRLECAAVLGGSQDESDGLYSELEEILEDEALRPEGHRIDATTTGGTYRLTILDAPPVAPAPPAEGCHCGEAWHDVSCDGVLGADAVTVEHMPEYLRASHGAAGNSGCWPHNGAVRLRVTPECAAWMVDHDPEGTSVVDD